MPQWENLIIMNLIYLKTKLNGCLFTTSFSKNLKSTKLPVKQVILLRYLMLYVTLPTSRLVTELCFMVLKINYGMPIKKYKRRICLKLAQVKKKHKKRLKFVPKSKMNRVTTRRLENILLSIDHVIKK